MKKTYWIFAYQHTDESSGFKAKGKAAVHTISSKDDFFPINKAHDHISKSDGGVSLYEFLTKMSQPIQISEEVYQTSKEKME